eukprot:3717867-Pleurochrysis_carterae.AAC.4
MITRPIRPDTMMSVLFFVAVASASAHVHVQGPTQVALAHRVTNVQMCAHVDQRKKNVAFVRSPRANAVKVRTRKVKRFTLSEEDAEIKRALCELGLTRSVHVPVHHQKRSTRLVSLPLEAEGQDEAKESLVELGIAREVQISVPEKETDEQASNKMPILPLLLHTFGPHQYHAALPANARSRARRVIFKSGFGQSNRSSKRQVSAESDDDAAVYVSSRNSTARLGCRVYAIVMGNVVVAGQTNKLPPHNASQPMSLSMDIDCAKHNRVKHRCKKTHTLIIIHIADALHE